ncbi:AhpD-like protein [Tricladium varicosporioides]|nr:AhpD-like protein [Hymenoscyphus varicosporioides]
MPLTPEQERLKIKFVDQLGAESWTPAWESVLIHHPPEVFLSSLKLLAVPATKKHLEPKIKHLISLTVNASSLHLHIPGIHASIALALSAGATKEEIIEVITLTSTVGIHACNVGVPLLVEVLKEEGVGDVGLGRGAWGNERDGAMDPREGERQALKEKFVKKRGYWHETWEDFLRLDPEFFDAYLEFSSAGTWEGGALEPKVKELVYCAFDAAATHLYQPGLKLHMRNAIRYGATPEEIMEVLEIATALSLHTLEVATPILAEHIK